MSPLGGLGAAVAGLVASLAVLLFAPESPIGNLLLLSLGVVLVALAMLMIPPLHNLLEYIVSSAGGLLALVGGAFLLSWGRDWMLASGEFANARLALSACVGLALVSSLAFLLPAGRARFYGPRWWFFAGLTPLLALMVGYDFFAYYVLWRDLGVGRLVIESGLKGVMVAHASVSLTVLVVPRAKLDRVVRPWSLLAVLNSAAGLLGGGFLILDALAFPGAPGGADLKFAVTWFLSGLICGTALVAVVRGSRPERGPRSGGEPRIVGSETKASS